MAESPASGLRRDLGVWSAASIVVGTVIGSGIFLVPASMVRHVGSPEAVLMVWICGGLLSLAGALTYAELAAALPEAGGEYVYLREAYGPFFGFLYNWTMSWVGKSGTFAAMATGFTLYLATFLPVLERPIFVAPLPIGPGGGPLEITSGQLVAIGLILAVGLINHYGVKLGGRVQILITAAKVALIGAIVVAGLWFGDPTGENLRSAVPATAGVGGFFAALVASLWAFDGWNNAALVAAEVKNPQRTLPRALVWGVAGVMGVYLLTNVAYFTVLPAQAVAASDRVAATMMDRVLGPSGAALVSIAAMLSIFGALNGSLLSGARIPYAAARDRLFFRSLGYVHPKYGTPSASIAALAGWASVLVLSGRFEQLFTYVIFSEWLLYLLAAAAVIVLRRRQPALPRPYRTPGYPFVPVLFVLAAMGLLAATLLQSPRESLLGLCIILAGIPYYFHRRSRARAA